MTSSQVALRTSFCSERHAQRVVAPNGYLPRMALWLLAACRWLTVSDTQIFRSRYGVTDPTSNKCGGLCE